jgi:hypothetical protein
VVSLLSLDTASEIRQHSANNPPEGLRESEITEEISYLHQRNTQLLSALRTQRRRPNAKRERDRLRFCTIVLALLAIQIVFAAPPVGLSFAVVGMLPVAYAELIVRPRDNRLEKTWQGLSDAIDERITALENEQLKRSPKRWTSKQ